jgi:PAS domain S-box-containing protein
MDYKENCDVLSSKAYYDPELFFELTLDLLCIAGHDGYFKKINPAVSLLLGYTEEELFSKPISYFIHEEDKEHTGRQRDELKKGVPLLHFENRYVTKSGEVVWLSWTSIPLEDQALVYAIAKDVTIKKRLEVERNNLITTLTQFNTNLKQLTYKTSHDLRAPVNNLMSLFDLIDDSTINENNLQLLKVMKASAKGMHDILNDLVESIRHGDRLDVAITELSFDQSVKNVLHTISALIIDSETVFHIDFSEVPVVNFNKSYLESIFLNLITNSIKYKKPGTVPDISMYSRKNNGRVEVVYRDKGLGFDMAEVKDRLFGLNQKFHQHNDSSGVGLYLIYNHMVSLGGKITVDSEVNQGATFTLSFLD